MSHPRRTALAAFLCLAPFLAAAAPALDLGLRASIYDENYELGVGGNLGIIATAGEKWDLGAHLNYAHFAPQSANWDAAEEIGGYLAAYYKPKIDQAFWLRLGPHLGYAYLVDHYVDLGADVMAVFKVARQWDFYAAFVPGYHIGADSQPMIRIGLGLEYVGNR